MIGEGQEPPALSEATLAKLSKPANRVNGFQTSHVMPCFDHDQNLMSELPVQTLVPSWARRPCVSPPGTE